MKILFLSDFIPPRNIGGPGKRVYELAQELSRKGQEVFFITSVQEKNIPLKETRNGLLIFNVYSNYHPRWRDYLSIYNFRILPRVEKIIKEIKPDIIQADGLHFHISYASLKIARKYGKKVFFTARDAMTFNYGKLWPETKDCQDKNYRGSFFYNFRQGKLRFNPLRNVFIRHYLKYVDKIFTNSDFLKEVLRQNGLENTFAVHNGLAVKDQKLEENAGVDFKFKHNIQGKKVIFLPGRLNKAKGSFVMLEIMPEIKKEVPEAILLMVGAGEDLVRAGTNDSAVILPWSNDQELLRSAYLASDVVVSPSLCYDTFPGVNLEAALYKKPAVSTCFGGAREFILDGITGYVVNPYNKKELAEKIIDLLKNEDKARQFGRASFERLKNEFSLEKQADKLLSWYQG